MEVELNNSRASERLAHERLQKEETRVMSLEKHVGKSETKYAKSVEEAAWPEKALRMRATFSKLSLRAERDRSACS